MRLHRMTVAAGLCILAGVTACSGSDEAPAADAATAQAEASALDPELDRLRTVTERFADVDAALAAGYIPDPSGMCITADMEGQPAENGSMGIHYLRPDLLGLAPPADGQRVSGNGMHTDFDDPSVLLYEPQADGSMTLVAIENLVFAEAWRSAGNTTPPVFLDEAYVHMLDDPATEADEAHGFEEHYELHMWIHRDNPRGVFTPFNPSVTCEHVAHAAQQSGE